MPRCACVCACTVMYFLPTRKRWETSFPMMSTFQDRVGWSDISVSFEYNFVVYRTWSPSVLRTIAAINVTKSLTIALWLTWVPGNKARESFNDCRLCWSTCWFPNEIRRVIYRLDNMGCFIDKIRPTVTSMEAIFRSLGAQSSWLPRLGTVCCQEERKCLQAASHHQMLVMYMVTYSICSICFTCCHHMLVFFDKRGKSD